MKYCIVYEFCRLLTLNGIMGTSSATINFMTGLCCKTVCCIIILNNSKNDLLITRKTE
jgi:hypothetical protein